MISALDCANWLIEQASDDINGGEYLTQLKVQKLLYFAQGISLYLLLIMFFVLYSCIHKYKKECDENEYKTIIFKERRLF